MADAHSKLLVLFNAPPPCLFFCAELKLQQQQKPETALPRLLRLVFWIWSTFFQVDAAIQDLEAGREPHEAEAHTGKGVLLASDGEGIWLSETDWVEVLETSPQCHRYQTI